MADGGEGTTIALCSEIINMKNCGPNYNIVDSYYGIMDDYDYRDGNNKRFWSCNKEKSILHNYIWCWSINY